MICVHNYLNKCETGSKPPGLIDFLRGTLALFKYSKKYNYKLIINKTIHPVFKFFKENEYYLDISPSKVSNVFELLSQSSAIFVDHILERLFQTGNEIHLITNCLLETKHNIDNESKEFIKTLLTPNDFLLKKLYKVYADLGMIAIGSNDIPAYQCLHIRFGDFFIDNDTIDYSIISSIYPTISDIVSSNDIPTLLISDSSQMAKEIQRLNKGIYYWDNNKVHMGDIGDKDDKIVDTLIDVLLLSKSCKIYTINVNKYFKTTFSTFIANIYNIENIFFQVD